MAATEYNDSHALVLGYPCGINPPWSHRLIDRVCRNVLCPVVLVRQAGDFHCDRVMAPYIHAGELEIVLPVLEALATVVHPRITFLHLLASKLFGVVKKKAANRTQENDHGNGCRYRL